MGVYLRGNYDGGWFPSADAFGCPHNALLRADNLVLDEVGALCLRQGSGIDATYSPFDPSVDSLYTAIFNGAELRMAGASNSVYFNGTRIMANNVTGTGDISFGTAQNQIFFARGTTKKKFDLFTVRNWGISPLIAAPTLSPIAGSLTGDFTAVIVAVYSNGTYQALSPPSAESIVLTVVDQGIRATIDTPTITGLDPQVNELWFYIFGGGMDQYYRAGVLTGGPWVGAQVIDTDPTVTVDDLVTQNITLEVDTLGPPDNIIGIEGPYYDRELVLTKDMLWLSRELNPDSFGSEEAIKVGDSFEEALWVKKIGEAVVFVGTNRDVYRIDGDLTPQPDGSINASKKPLGVSNPPVSSAVCGGKINGIESVVYLSGSGWQVVYGGTLTNSQVDLLWRGYPRHGVPFVNIVNHENARFRCVITKNQFSAITPEGTATDSSNVIHRYDFSKQKWYRLVYTANFRSICTEPDGDLLAGDNNSTVWLMNLATLQDNGNDIPITMWTEVDDNDQQFLYKAPENLIMQCETGANTATVNFHRNGSDVADGRITFVQAATDTATLDIRGKLKEFNQLQMRITGSFNTFRFRGYQLNYLDEPTPYLVHDTGFIDLGLQAISWIRAIRVKAKSDVDMILQPYFDGTAAPSKNIPVIGYAGQPFRFESYLQREQRGYQVRAVVTSQQPSQVYWIEFEYNQSGQQVQKKIVHFSGVA